MRFCSSVGDSGINTLFNIVKQAFYSPNDGYRPSSIWTTDPLFMKVDSEYYYYQNDHLGTPQKLADYGGSVVWSAVYKSFGECLVDPSSIIENNLRFAGQYFDHETGLSYNYFRYYCPETGRYLTPDPIGLRGGVNLFAYSINNPVNRIDPYGLNSATWLPNISAAVAAASATAAAIASAAIAAAPAVAAGVVIAVGAAGVDYIDNNADVSQEEIDHMYAGGVGIPAPAMEAGHGNQDPPWVPGYTPYNPGHCNGRCVPCEDSEIFYHPDQSTHPCRGHQIRHRQSPYPDCRCWPYRHNF